jgi:hypothetical protein
MTRAAFTASRVYRDAERQIALGDPVQFTAPNRTLSVANRELATMKAISPYGDLSLKMDRLPARTKATARRP